MSLTSLGMVEWAIVAAGLLLAALLLRALARRRREPGYMRQVRRFVRRRDFRRGGELLFRHGHMREALGLFERGKVHEAAAECAERLGDLALAAYHRERAGFYAQAADQYLEAGDYASASRLYARLGNFMKAAKVLAKSDDAPPLELARLWENAFLDTVPSEGEAIRGAEFAALQLCAQRAAEAFEHAGELPKAAHYFEIGGLSDRANALRMSLPPTELDRLDAARDRLLARLQSATAEAVEWSGTFPVAVLNAGFPPAPRDAAPRAASRSAARDAIPEPPAPPRSAAPPARSRRSLAGSGMRAKGAPPSRKAQANRGSTALEAGTSADPRPRPAPEAPLLARRVDDAPPSSMAAGLPPSPERYQLVEAVGRRGFGVAYRAFDRVQGRDVSVIHLPSAVVADDERQETFLATCRTLTEIRHPNIVSLLDCGIYAGRGYVVLEWIDGPSLATELAHADRGRMSVLEVLDVAEGLLSALDYAHDRGVTHGTINPRAVYLQNESIPKVMHLGMSQLASPTSIASFTPYLAPEQIDGEPAEARSDLFAVGATVYELLTGKKPFDGLERQDPPKSPREISTAIPKSLDQLVMWCLKLDPEQRPASASALRNRVRSMHSQVESFLRPKENAS